MNRLAVIERTVANRADRVLRQVVLRHREQAVEQRAGGLRMQRLRRDHALAVRPRQRVVVLRIAADADVHAVPVQRPEEHTSELQSLMRISYAVFFLKKTY